MPRRRLYYLGDQPGVLGSQSCGTGVPPSLDRARETFYHRDGKQQLGMGDCQLRDSEGQTRHMYLVMLAYSLLMQQLRQGHAYDWAFQKLTEHRRSLPSGLLRETLRTTLTWAMDHMTNPWWTKERVIAHVGPSRALTALSVNFYF